MRRGILGLTILWQTAIAAHAQMPRWAITEKPAGKPILELVADTLAANAPGLLWARTEAGWACYNLVLGRVEASGFARALFGIDGQVAVQYPGQQSWFAAGPDLSARGLVGPTDKPQVPIGKCGGDILGKSERQMLRDDHTKGLYTLREDATGKTFASRVSTTAPVYGLHGVWDKGLVYKKGGKWWRVDSAGAAPLWLKTPKIAWVKLPGELGLWAFSPDGAKVGFIDNAGYVRVAPRYASARPFAGKAAVVSLTDNRLGLIDRDEHLLAQPIYAELTAQLHGLYLGFVYINGQYSRADLLGPAPAWHVFSADTIVTFGTQYAFRRANRWGLLSAQGQELCEARYDALTLAAPGHYLAHQGGYAYILDENAKVAAGPFTEPVLYLPACSLYAFSER